MQMTAQQLLRDTKVTEILINEEWLNINDVSVYRCIGSPVIVYAGNGEYQFAQTQMVEVR